MQESDPEMIHSLLNMVEHKTKEILDSDVRYEMREAARWAKEKGLIRKKTDDEIHNELLRKPWIEVNRIIRSKEREQEDVG
jgi:hypothetical protein